MTVFRTLVSGSSGNCVLFSHNGTNILIDCGMSGKRASELLNASEIAPESLRCIFVTHEHIDHASGVGVMSRKYNIPVAASVGTWDGMNIGRIAPENIISFSEFAGIDFGDFSVTPFEIPHDANMPTGYVIDCGGKKYAVATDIGHVTEKVMTAVSGCESVLLEANYDAKMLETGSYPYPLKKRIAGDYGHLCNTDSGRFAAYLVKHGTKRLLLGHLSIENNTEKTAFDTVSSALEYEGIHLGRHVDVTIAPRYAPSVNAG